jgi:hypothetical protein
LLLTSRLLARPVSGSIKGPSSAGKSHLVEQALAFFPASAYYTLSAMSERALAYSQEPLAHRVLVIYEAAGLQGEFASYLMRSLLSEGRVRYETVEKTKDGLRPRLIEREGPTGLLVTTTALRLHPENETRMLSLPVTDTADQTRSIMLAQAGSSEVSTDPPPGGDALADWKALQDWLASSGSRVVVPFATPLADAIPPVAVRLRRDFPTVLSLIRAHALLHQASRDRDSRGWVIATVEDYTIVRGLVADLVADGVEASVSPVLRETVHAVATIHGRTAGDVSVAGLAAELGLDKGPASRRARSAMDRGYLRNLEERRGRPARYVLEDPLPEDRPILPEPERLLAEDRCRVAGETEGMYTPPSPPEREEVVL